MNDKSLVLLQDGTYADPSDISRGNDGKLRHKNGVGVALRDDGDPVTLGHAVDMNAKAAVISGPEPQPNGAPGILTTALMPEIKVEDPKVE